jgi:HD-GYP domain-containing protein (c-di-GMP phosphodiesterase class II)
MELLPLIRSKVFLGQPLPWNVRDREGGLLLRQGQVVETERQLALLLDRGATVNVDEARTAAREAIDAAAALRNRRPHTVSLFDLWSKLGMQLKQAWNSVNYPSVFGDAIEVIAEELKALSLRDPDIGIYLIIRQDRANHIDYSYDHSIHTAFSCMLMGRRLEWSNHEVDTIVRAALTMNVSIGELQGRMSSQDFPMLDRQETKIRRHPHETAALLSAAGITDEDWLRTVRDHHEHVDGSGYPAGKRTADKLAQALRLADVFTAKLTPRMIRAPLSPQEAERHMFAEGKIDPVVMTLAMALIREFGIYPPGDLVELKSGEIGVVVKRSANTRTPVVAAITDNRGRTVTTTIRRDTADAQYAITGTVSNKALVARLPPERLFGYSVA